MVQRDVPRWGETRRQGGGLSPQRTVRAGFVRVGPALRVCLLLLVVALVSSVGPHTIGHAAGSSDDIVIQGGTDFSHGTLVDVVTQGGALRVGAGMSRVPLAPPVARSGSYTSVPVTVAHSFRVLTISVTATIPSRAVLEVAVRTALPAGPWTPWSDVPASTPGVIQGPTATRWQYRLRLAAASADDSPRVQGVTVRTVPLPPGYPTTPPPPTPRVSYQVYATREGLVGGVTADGHRIRPHDHFVALPSDTVLACDGCRDYTVTISYQGRTTTRPVWDIGPWNTADPYWQRPRTPFRALPQGVAAARAAYQKAYQGGRDVFDRPVANPAGIDLADGVFWDDLHLTGNDWVTVTYNWQSGPPAPARPDAAAWIKDSYQGLPARVITLTTDTRSDPVTVWFKNLGTARWNARTVLAVYDPRHPTAPPAASALCNPFGPDGQPDWVSCDPGVPAYIGNGRTAGPGSLVPFTFYLKAPDAVGDAVLYLKLAQQVADRYQWLNQPNGQDSFDAIRVHVIPLPLSRPATPTTPIGLTTPAPTRPLAPDITPTVGAEPTPTSSPTP